MGCLAGSCCLWLGAVSLVPCVEWRHVIWEDSGSQGWLWGVDPQWWLSFNLMKGNVWFGPPALGIAGSRRHFPRAGVRLGTHIRAPCSWLQAQSSSQDGQRCLSLCPHPAGPPPAHPSSLTGIWGVLGTSVFLPGAHVPLQGAIKCWVPRVAAPMDLQGGMLRASSPPPPPPCLGLSGSGSELGGR